MRARLRTPACGRGRGGGAFPNGIQGSVRPEAKRYRGVGLQSLQNRFFGKLHGTSGHRFDIGGSRATFLARCCAVYFAALFPASKMAF
jgi:hypothetical protein